MTAVGLFEAAQPAFGLAGMGELDPFQVSISVGFAQRAQFPTPALEGGIDPEHYRVPRQESLAEGFAIAVPERFARQAAADRAFQTTPEDPGFAVVEPYQQ